MAERRGPGCGSNRRRPFGLALALGSVVLLASCAPQGSRPVAAPVAQEAPPGFPDVDYRQAAARGEAVYRIEPERSLVAIEVRRGGPLARLGHDHVVSSRSVQGYVTLGQRRADLTVPLDRLIVDDAELRKAAGFDTQPSTADVEGTRINMLERILQAERYPRLVVQVRQGAGVPGGAGAAGNVGAGDDMEIAITLHGVTRKQQIPVRLEVERDAIVARGAFSVLQSDFGIMPFALLGGIIQVQDRLSVSFELRGRRFTP